MLRSDIFRCPKCHVLLSKKTSQSTKNPNRDYFAHVSTYDKKEKNWIPSQCSFFKWCDQLNMKDLIENQKSIKLECLQKQLRVISDSSLNRNIRWISRFLSARDTISLGLINRSSHNNLLNVFLHLSGNIQTFWNEIIVRISRHIRTDHSIDPLKSPSFFLRNVSLRAHMEHLASNIFDNFFEHLTCDECTFSNSKTHHTMTLFHKGGYCGHISFNIPLLKEDYPRKTHHISKDHTIYYLWLELSCLHYNRLTVLDYDRFEDASREEKILCYLPKTNCNKGKFKRLMDCGKVQQ